jgi:hypothetical protein
VGKPRGRLARRVGHDVQLDGDGHAAILTEKL